MRVAEVPVYGGGVVPRIYSVKEAADAFESILWQQVLKESFRTVGGDFFSEEGEKGIYMQLVLWRISDYMSKSVDTDIGRRIYEKFSQGYRNPASHPIYKTRKTDGEVRHES